MKRSIGLVGVATAVALMVAGSLLTWSPAASADPVYGTQSISYSGVANPPTSDKPQSKLWWNDGSWWADMWTTGSGWHIYRLDRATHTWVDSGVLNDNRGNTLADTLWDGTHLYIASHVVTVSTDTTSQPSISGQPAYLYRYSYSSGKYTLDSGFPSVITNNSSESMTIDEDTTGAIWATWTQVAGDSTSGYTNTVYVNDSAPGGSSWASAFVLPVSNPHPEPDDISSVVAYGNKKIGVMWTDQLTGSVWWATRTDGTAPTSTSSWNVQPAIQGNGQADDHLNLKSLQSDPSGRVFAAVKTSLDTISSDPTLPQLLLLVFKPGTGAFTQSTISTTGDCVTRPQILLDTQNNLVHAFQTAPPTSVTGCAYSGGAGSIYEKTASMDNPVFASGRGTPVIQSASSSNMNNVTTTKQGVNTTTGLVVMASDDVAKNYWFADESIVPTTTSPVASFTATPKTGTAPLPVTFADTSTGSPTSWAWTFGDGATSTIQSPTHSYTTAGTYTATLTATNSTGSSSTSTTITVNAPAASFTATPTSGTLPLSVAFQDTSTGTPSSWSWNFGDGATSTLQNPTHVYSAAGTYTATLTTAYSGGGTSSANETITASTLAQAMDAKAAQWNLGAATSNVTAIRNGGYYRNYQYGAIISTPWQSLFVSHGAIRNEWAALAFENGLMGYPTTDEVGGLVNGGVYQNYEGGAIIWNYATGAHESVGVIRSEWAQLGFEG
ncbi:PKD domain-containing protein, partial [Pseudarthrobacter sp. NPDC080037]